LLEHGITEETVEQVLAAQNLREANRVKNKKALERSALFGESQKHKRFLASIFGMLQQGGKSTFSVSDVLTKLRDTNMDLGQYVGKKEILEGVNTLRTIFPWINRFQVKHVFFLKVNKPANLQPSDHNQTIEAYFADMLKQQEKGGRESE